MGSRRKDISTADIVRLYIDSCGCSTAFGRDNILLKAIFETQLAYLHPFAVAVDDISSEEDLERYFADAEEIFNLKERTPVELLGTVEGDNSERLAHPIYPTLQDVPRMQVASGPVH